MKTFLFIILLCISQIHSQNIYTDTTCSYSVSLPQGWSIEKIKPPFFQTECAFGLKYPGWEEISSDTVYDVGEYALYISIYDGSLYDNSKKYEFEYRDSTWWINGRAGYQNEGSFVQTRDWDAIIGETEVGAYLKGGGYFGTASAYVAILDNKKGKLLEIVADSMFQDKTIFDSIVFNISF